MSFVMSLLLDNKYSRARVAIGYHSLKKDVTLDIPACAALEQLA
jgi:hypothetical protein